MGEAERAQEETRARSKVLCAEFSGFVEGIRTDPDQLLSAPMRGTQR
jgi:hypothetical protein